MMRKRQEVAKLYCAHRDAVLRALDPMQFLSFCAQNRLPLSDSFFQGAESVPLIMATMHKTRLDIKTFTPAEKLASARWLLANNFRLPEHLWLDGDVVVGAEYETD